MSEQKIGNIEAIALVLTVIINHIILNLPKNIIKSTSSGAIINTIFISLVALIIVYIITQLWKNFSGSDILDISHFLGGKYLKIIMGILFICYFIFTISITVRSFSETLKIVFFPRVPVTVIILLFLISAVIVNRLGFKPIVRTNLFFMPIILFSILFIFLANFGHFTIQRATPILGNGISSTFFSGISNLFAFSGLAYLYLIPPHLKDQKDYSKISFTSIGISAVFLLMSVSTLLLMFPLLASNEEVIPLYLASRFIEFGRFFQRLDAVFVFIWIISILSYISISFNFTASIFQKITKIQSTKWIYGIFSIIVFGVCLLPTNIQFLTFLANVVYKYVILILVICISVGILVFANIKFLVQQRKKGLLLTNQVDHSNNRIIF